MKNIKKYLCAIVMMVISMTAFAQEDVFSFYGEYALSSKFCGVCCLSDS